MILFYDEYVSDFRRKPKGWMRSVSWRLPVLLMKQTFQKIFSITGNEGDPMRTFVNHTRPEICSHNYGVHSIFGLFMKS